MKNKKIYKFILVIFFLILHSEAISNEQFQFNVKEVEILENGNLIKGLKRGTIETDDGIIIEADNFEYNKITNIVEIEGNVEIQDTSNDITIFSDKGIYLKNEEIIITDGNSKAFDKNNRSIKAQKFKYSKTLNTINAKQNAVIEDTAKDYIIFADDITYFKNDEKIITLGETKSIFKSTIICPFLTNGSTKNISGLLLTTLTNEIKSFNNTDFVDIFKFEEINLF